MAASLFSAARACLDACTVDAKLARSRSATLAWGGGALTITGSAAGEDAVAPIAMPGRPARPELVAPGRLAQRRLNTLVGRAALIHAVAHIEFNAIDLAWDAVYRFRALPRAYYDDWVRVATEETQHFTLLQARLQQLGYTYGDFPAHNGLWEMACATAHDALVRMALVPRVLEARGLDVTPNMIRRLEAAGDGATAEVLRVILREEIGHVAIGTRWFRYLCAQRDLTPDAVFAELLRSHARGRIKGPFAQGARLAAGFSRRELADLQVQAAGQEGAVCAR